MAIERHAHAPLAARVAALMRDEPPFDVVHAEQLQALPIAEPARRAGVACVLREQNVESAVWDATAGEAPAWRAAAMRLEARRLRRFEARAIGDVDATITLSRDDADALTQLSPSSSSRITVIAPPIPSAWFTPSDQPGEQSVFTWIGSGGWAPNDGARSWLLDEIWPAIAARLPGARLHVFGAAARTRAQAQVEGESLIESLHPDQAGARGKVAASGGPEPESVFSVPSNAASGGAATTRGAIVWRGVPRESVEAFMPGSILLIPMRAAAGVRMRVLEAWARGVPVIASPAAIAGLDAEDGRDVLVAADGREFAEAAARLNGDPSLRAKLVHGGRATLARRHDARRIAEATLEVYRQAIAWRRARR